MSEIYNFVTGNNDPSPLTEKMPDGAFDMSVSAGLGVDSGKAARVLKLQTRTGLPQQAIEDNLDTLEREVRKEDFNPDEFRKNSPLVAQWMAENPQHFALIKDEVGFWGGLEQAGRSMAESWANEFDMRERTAIIRKEFEGGELTPVERARSEKLKGDMMYRAQQTQDESTAEYLSRVGTSSVFQLGQSAYKLAEGVAYGGVAGGVIGAPTGLGVAVTIPSGMVVGGVLSMATYTYDLEAPLAFDEYRNLTDIHGEKIDDAIARDVAKVVGMLNASIEVAGTAGVAALIPGVRGLVGKITGKDTAKQALNESVKAALRNPTTRDALVRGATGLLGAGAIEGGEEFFQALMNAAGREGAQALSDQIFAPDSFSEDLEGATAQAKDAFFGMMVTLGLGVGGARLYHGLREAKQADQARAFYEAINEGVANSESHKALPEKTREIVERITKDGPLQDVYIDAGAWTTYWQNKDLDPKAIASEVFGSNTTEYDNAVKADSVIRVPLADYAAKLAGTEHGAFFAKELRQEPDAMNAREGEQLSKDIEKRAKETLEQNKAVHDEISARLVGLGYEQSTANTMAAQMGARFNTLAKNLGIADPMALFKRYGVNIIRPETLPQGAMEQPLTPDIERKLVGTKVVGKGGEPLRVYHGSSVRATGDVVIEKFFGVDEEARSSPADNPFNYIAALGTFFSESSKIAETYPHETNLFDSETDYINAQNSGDNFDIGRVIYPVYLNIKNPLKFKNLFEFKKFLKKENRTPAELVADLMDDGYDGIEFKEGSSLTPESNQKRAWVAFKEGAIVSSITGQYMQSDAYKATDVSPLGFYSGLARAVQGINQKSAPATQWLGTIMNAPGVKKAEVEAVGLKEWLDLMKDFTLTKDAVLQFIADNGVKVEETMLGDNGQAAINMAITELESLGFDVIYNLDSFRDGLSQGRVPILVIQDDNFAYVDKKSEYLKSSNYQIIKERRGWVVHSKVDGADLAVASNEEDADWAKSTQLGHYKPITEAGEEIQVAFWKLSEVLDTAANGDPTVDEGREAFIENYVEEARQEWEDDIRARWDSQGFVGSYYVKPVGDKWAVAYDGSVLDPEALYDSEELAQQEAGELNAQQEADAFDNFERENPFEEGDVRDIAAEDWAEDWAEDDRGGVKFAQYVEPGGKVGTYRELLLTIPLVVEKYKVWRFRYGNGTSSIFSSREDVVAYLNISGIDPDGDGVVIESVMEESNKGGFNEPHYNRDDIIAHTRFDEREVNGKRDLRIAEVQSAWGQAGHKVRKKMVEAEAKELKITVDEANKLIPKNAGFKGSVPAAPFVTDTQAWAMLVMKRMIRYAAENGFDTISWDAGETQVRRYESALRKVVDEIRWKKTESGIHLLGYKDGKMTVNTVERENEISDAIGKAMGDRIIDDPNQSGVIKGDNITVSDTGMAGFYDRMLPKMVNEYIKKFGAKAEYMDSARTVPVSENDLVEKLVAMGDDPVGALAKAEILANITNLDDAYDNMTVDGGMTPAQAKEVIEWMKARGAGGHVNTSVFSFPVTPAMKEAALAGQLYYQDKARGFITIGPDKKMTIGLMESANLSTFLHESGHLYLEMMRDLSSDSGWEKLRQMIGLESQDPPGRAQLKEDSIIIAKFLGADNLDNITVEQHERFARAFEAYLMEGKSPSIELRSAFARFRAWLMALYVTVKGLGVKLNPEIRGVFDRMLATQEEIDAAKAEALIAPKFLTAEQAGVTDTVFAAYSKLIGEASIRAQEELQQKIMRQMRREQKMEWNRRKDAERDDVVKELDSRKDYAALKSLVEGEHKLSRNSLYAMYPGKFADNQVMQSLHKLGVYRSEEGVHPDEAASLLGYSSGDELVRALIDLKPKNQAIDEMVDQRMKAKYGDILADGTIADEAKKAVLGPSRSKVLEAELKMFRELERRARPGVRAVVREQRAGIRSGLSQLRTSVPSVSVVRRIARDILAQTQVRHVNPTSYMVAARNSSKLATEAAGKGDWAVAAHHTQKELLNTELYREAVRIKSDVQGILEYARSFDKLEKRERIGLAGDQYLEQIDSIRERFNFSRMSTKEADKRKALAQWITEQQDKGVQINLSEDIINEAYRKSNRDMTYDELVGVRDALKHISHMAGLKNKLLKSKAARELNAVVGLLEETAAINARNRSGVGRETHLPQEALGRAFGSFLSGQRKMSSLAREMDGFADGGAWWTSIIWPLNDAAAREAMMHEQINKKLHDVFKPYTTVSEQLKTLVTTASLGHLATGLYEKKFIPEINDSLTKAGRIMVALNWGNEGNRARILEMYDQDGVNAILAGLSKEDWNFVQGIWDLIDSMWPEVEALSKRVDGVAPEKVQPTPVMTVHGEYRGGYFPLKYDDRQSPRAFSYMAKEAADRAMRGAAVRAVTAHGHRIERVDNVKMPVRLDFGVIFEHFNEVIHDLTHYETLIDLNRIVGHKRTQGAIIGNFGDTVYRQFRSALNDVAAGNIMAQTQLDKSLNWIRKGAAIVGMGWKVTTALLQPLGLTQSMVRVGPTWIAKGVGQWLGNAARMQNTVKWVHSKSDLMQERSVTQTREINEIRNQVAATGVLGPLQDSYFYLIVKLQMVADIPTWLGQYEKSLHELEYDAASSKEEADAIDTKAVALADQAVLDSQGSGMTKDQSAFYRGGPGMRIWTLFGTFFNATYNITAEKYRMTKFKNPHESMRFAADMLLLYTVPAVLGVLIKDGLRGDLPDDPDDILEKMGREMISYMAGTVLLARELTGAIQGYKGYSGPAGAKFFADAARLINQAEQGEADEAFFRALSSTGGVLFHLPTGQLQKSVEGFMYIMDHDEPNPLPILVGPPKEG